MPLDFEKLAEVIVALIISSSILLVAAAIAWRLAVKPTFLAFLDSRTARAGADPVLSRRVSELEKAPRPQGQAGRLAGRQSLAAGCRHALARDEGEGLSATRWNEHELLRKLLLQILSGQQAARV